MNNRFRNMLCAVLALTGFAAQGTAMAQSNEEAKLVSAATVLDELRGQRDTLIPEHLLQRAYGVAVIPKVTKVALVLGGRRGNGVLSIRDGRGRFSNPIFVNLTGASFGVQWGAQETDIVLVFTTRKGIEGITDGKLTLGVGASVAAGPVGRQAEAAAGMSAEVYAYSRSRGLFAGIALDGTSISINEKGNRNFYGGKDVLPSEIVSGAAAPQSENTSRFLAALARSTGESAEAPGTATVANPNPSSTSQPAAQPGSGGVQTFPMEDPSPGKEPPR